MSREGSPRYVSLAVCEACFKTLGYDQVGPNNDPEPQRSCVFCGGALG